MIFLFLWNSAKVCSYKEELTARIKSYQFCLKIVLPRPLPTRVMPQNMKSFLMGKPVTSVSFSFLALKKSFVNFTYHWKDISYKRKIGPRYVRLVTLLIHHFFNLTAVLSTIQSNSFPPQEANLVSVSKLFNSSSSPSFLYTVTWLSAKHLTASRGVPEDANRVAEWGVSLKNKKCIRWHKDQ